MHYTSFQIMIFRDGTKAALESYPVLEDFKNSL